MHISRVKVYSKLRNVVSLKSCSFAQLSTEFNVQVAYFLSFVNTFLCFLMLEEVELAVALLGENKSD